MLQIGKFKLNKNSSSLRPVFIISDLVSSEPQNVKKKKK